MIKIFKFGGASVKDAAAVRNMASIISRYSIDNKLLVVVSAMGKTTNSLESLYDIFKEKDAREKQDEQLSILKKYHFDITRELFPNQGHPVYEVLNNFFDKLEATLTAQSAAPVYDEGYDQVISYGELISTVIVAHYLNEIGQQTRWLDARKYIQTNTLWREAGIDWVWTEKKVAELLPFLENQIVLTQGFIGGTVDGRTTTLGREGSDYTAAIFASVLQAQSLTIWKDVPGILNADPKRIPGAVLYEKLSYKEAAEMTYYGATVIHPKTISPLVTSKIPLHVRSFIEPDKAGTCIEQEQPAAMVPAIIFKPNQRVISFNVKDFTFITEKNVSTILEALQRLNIHINMMQNSAISFSVCIDNNAQKAEKLQQVLEEDFVIHYNEQLQIITIKNYTDEVISSIMKGKEIILEQRSRSTYQAIVHE